MPVLFLAALVAAAAATGCKDSSGRSVDWFAAIKFPSGDSYAVFTPTSKDFEMSSKGLASGGAIVETLKQVYDGTASSYVMFNDETPDGTKSTTYGHTKGVAGWSSRGGFYLVHSIPRFPPKKSDGYSFPQSGSDNGQSFLCISMSKTELEKVGDQWQYNRPQYYDTGDVDVTSISASVSGTHYSGTTGPTNNLVSITSSGGRSFDYFAKTAWWGKDIYSDFIAPTYKANLISETWQNGVGPLPSECTDTYHVLNANEVEFVGTSWSETKDHSKWCVTDGGSTDRVCIGDINRQHGQTNRGGGMLCLDGDIHTPFQDAIVGDDKCSGSYSYDVQHSDATPDHPANTANILSRANIAIIALGSVGIALLFAGMVLFIVRRYRTQPEPLLSLQSESVAV